MSKKTISVIAAIGIIIFGFGIVMIRNSSRLSGIQFSKINETEYTVMLNGEEYVLKYVPRKNIAPFYGLARFELGVGFALVRDDLPKRIQKSVAYHEIYHLHDFSNNLHNGKLFREIHANLAALPYEPIGFVQTVLKTLTDPDRIAYYMRLILK